VKFLKVASIVIPFIALALSSTQDQPEIKTFDQPKESASAKKIIEENYKILHKAIREEKSEAAIDVIHEDFNLVNAIVLPVIVDEDADIDFDSYLSQIDDGETNGGFEMSSHNENSKIESKITEFIGGRRLCMARFVESLSETIVDEDGEFGKKGENATIKYTTIYSDQWIYDVSGDKGNAWQLLNREFTSIEISINGKPLDLNKIDGVVLSKLSREAIKS
jgi:hypothetical protein